MPARRRPLVAAAVSSKLCIRLMARWTTGSKLCTPRLARFTPPRASASIIGARSVRGSISIAISAEGSTKKACLIDPIRSVKALRRHDGRRSPAEMDVVDLEAAVDLPRHQIDLAAKRRLVDGNGLVAVGDRGVAAAIPAHRPAERDMQIERGGGVRRNGPQPFGIGLRTDGARKMRSGRIARVAGQPLLPVARRKILLHLLTCAPINKYRYRALRRTPSDQFSRASQRRAALRWLKPPHRKCGRAAKNS